MKWPGLTFQYARSERLVQIPTGKRQTMPMLSKTNLIAMFMDSIIGFKSSVATIVRMTRCSNIVHATCILGSAILIYGPSLIILRKELLHFPVSLFCAHAEFKILFGDGVPILFRGQQRRTWVWTNRQYLIDHHDGQQITYRSKE